MLRRSSPEQVDTTRDGGRCSSEEEVVGGSRVLWGWPTGLTEEEWGSQGEKRSGLRWTAEGKCAPEERDARGCKQGMELWVAESGNIEGGGVLDRWGDAGVLVSAKEGRHESEVKMMRRWTWRDRPWLGYCCGSAKAKPWCSAS